MYSRTDLVIEALAAGAAAVVSAVLLDRLQIGRRAINELARGAPPSRSTVFRMLARARLFEALVAALVFRSAMAGARRGLRGFASQPRLEQPRPGPASGWRAIPGRRASPASARAT